MSILHRVVATQRQGIAFFINGQACRGMVGDTVLTAVLTQREHVRVSKFDAGGDVDVRAGFCLMGACHDCLATVDGVPECQTCLLPLRDGMQVHLCGDDAAA